MPVGDDGVGVSGATIDKETGFDKIVRSHIATCEKILGKERWTSPVYQYIDTNAGSGYNESVSCDGSPVIFLRAINECSLPYYAHFVEIDYINSSKLRQCVSGWDNYTVVTGDNRVEVPQIIEWLPRNSYGLLYSDPNGVPDFEMLAEASRHRRMRRIDILIRCAASAVKRTHHISGKRVQDYLNSINKKYWIIRELARNDKWQWTFLLGMNWRGWSAWENQGFYYADKKEIQRTWNKINYTDDEWRAMCQPKLM